MAMPANKDSGATCHIITAVLPIAVLALFSSLMEGHQDSSSIFLFLSIIFGFYGDYPLAALFASHSSRRKRQTRLRARAAQAELAESLRVVWRK